MCFYVVCFVVVCVYRYIHINIYVFVCVYYIYSYFILWKFSNAKLKLSSRNVDRVVHLTLPYLSPSLDDYQYVANFLSLISTISVTTPPAPPRKARFFWGISQVYNSIYKSFKRHTLFNPYQYYFYQHISWTWYEPSVYSRNERLQNHSFNRQVLGT